MTDPPRPQTAAEARAEVEARREERRAERDARLAAAYPNGVPGRAIVVASWISTGLLGVTTLAAVVSPDDFITAFFAVAMVLFLAGTGLFALDVVLAAARSRDDLMGIGGLFFLAGCAPRTTMISMNASLAVAVSVSIAGAAADPFTPLAFGTLAPMFQLAATGLWGVRHGTFPPRRAPA